MVTGGQGDEDRDRDEYERYICSVLDDLREAERISGPDRASEECERGPRKLLIPLRGRASLQAVDSPRLSVEEIQRAFSQASQRVGHSEEDRARWLVGFAVADLSRLSQGQRLDLEWEILAFITPPRSSFLHLEIDTDREIRVPVDELHAWIRVGIESLRGDLPPGIEVDVEKDEVTAEVEKLGDALQILAERRRPGYRPSWVLSANTTCHLFRVGDRVIADTREGVGSMLGRFEAEVLLVLSSEVERFRFCRNCREPFIARKRQAYCSPTCSQTFRTRTYRAKDPERARARRHADHVRAQKKIHGENVKVGHRTPKNPG